jgi:seryl-tRNA synthetase
VEKKMLIQALFSFENAIKAKTFGEGDIKHVEKARYNIKTIKSSEALREEITHKINELASEIKNLDKDRNEKFNAAGQIAYSEYVKNKPSQPPAVTAKWDEIQDIDTLIAKNKQDLNDLAQREKKSGFLAKLSDSIVSTAKHGKLKLDVHNLERKKDRIITEFGSVLYDSHKKGDETLEELSSIWQNIDDLEQQISKNEGEIANLRKYV